jgi:putative ABC transport system permease protein
MTALRSSWPGEILESAKVNLASAFARPALSIIVILGFAAAVVVCVSVLSVAQGISETLHASAAHDVAIVYSAASTAEMGSTLTAEAIGAIAAHPGIMLQSDQPIVSPSFLSSFVAQRAGSEIEANVTIRGVGPSAFQLYPDFQVVKGRTFRPGLAEVIVGEQAMRQFRGLSLGDRFEAGNTRWTVVGMFRNKRSASESEVWTDTEMLQSAFNVGDIFSSAHVKLQSAAALQTFEASIRSDPRLDVKVESQPAYNERLGRWVITLVSTAGVGIGILMGIAAIVGAVNIMNTSIAIRERELATLRAVGFRRSSVLLGVLIEGAVLGGIAGVAGAAIAFLGFNGYQTSTVNPLGFTQTAFTLAVTPRLVGAAIVWSIGMGVLGAFLPAMRAAWPTIARVLAGDQ